MVAISEESPYYCIFESQQCLEGRESRLVDGERAGEQVGQACRKKKWSSAQQNNSWNAKSSFSVTDKEHHERPRNASQFRLLGSLCNGTQYRRSLLPRIFLGWFRYFNNTFFHPIVINYLFAIADYRLGDFALRTLTDKQKTNATQQKWVDLYRKSFVLSLKYLIKLGFWRCALHASGQQIRQERLV